MKSQNLTKRQYRKTNWSMYIIMVLACILCTGIDVSNMSKTAFTSNGDCAMCSISYFYSNTWDYE